MTNIPDSAETPPAPEALAAQIATLQAQLDASPDGILVVDARGRMTSYNQRFADIWSIPPEVIASKSDALALKSITDKLADPQQFLERVQYLYQHHETHSKEDILLKDGRTLERHSSPILGPEGSYRGRVWYFRDISERKLAEAALRESEAFTKFVLDNLPVGVAVNSVDAEVKFNYANDSFLKHYRITRAALDNADKFWEAVYESPQFRAEIRKRVLEDCSSGDPARMRWDNIPITRKGEITTYISARNVPIRKNNLMLSIVWDVTDHKLAEETLRQNERFLSDVIENVPDMIFIKDAQDLRFIRFNKAGERLLGYPRESLLGKNDYDLFPKKEADFFTATDREVLAKKQLHDVPEEKIRTARQGERLLHTKKIPILDDAGNPKYLLGISEDITERKLAEAIRIESETKYRALFERAGDYIIVLEAAPEGLPLIRDLNEAALKKHGFSREELIGKPISVLDLDAGLPSISERERASLTGDGAIFEVRHRCKDGTTFTAEASVKPLDIKGKKLLISIERDITERRKAESALRESESRFRIVVEGAPEAIFVQSAGRFVYINPAACRLFGAARPE
jgi:PAS domain S-box-containing protein